MANLQIERAERTTFCSYEEGMFSHEPWGNSSHDFYKSVAAIKATCHHEAGHAVLYYALGAGIVGIEIKENTGGRALYTKDFRERAQLAKSGRI